MPLAAGGEREVPLSKDKDLVDEERERERGARGRGGARGDVWGRGVHFHV